ncbi:MAG: NAD(+) synthase [Acidobacteriota bacterium]
MKLRLALAQINPKTGDIRGNACKILKGIGRAREEGCDLVVFPEMCLTGYCLDEKLLINPQFLRENRLELMEKILPACRGIAAVVGFIDFDEQRRGPDNRIIRHNAAAIIQDGELIQIVRKRLLPSYRYFDDKRYFEPGTEVEPAQIKIRRGSVRIGVLICEDLWDRGYTSKPCALYKEKGVDYLFCINASPFVASAVGERNGKRFRREALIREQIERYDVPIVYVNTVGIGDNGKNIIPFDGFSMGFDRSGRRVASLKQFEEDQRSICFEDGRAEPVDEPAFDREAEIYDALVMSVRDYFDKVGIFKRVLEAVSGGIDSALGSAIAYEAMGPERLSLYNLPSRYNSATTQRLARQLAENFGVDFHVVPIQEMVDQITRDFEQYLHPMAQSTTLENLQARVRGLIMMAESNDQQGLLLTNGNETEIALGYATLYGDMVGGLSVIGDLPKPDVYRLARYVNRRWAREMIPEGIFTVPPSAELKQDQVDPFDYDVVGPILSDFIEKGLSPDDLVGEFEECEIHPGLYAKYDRAQFRELVEGLYRSLNRSVYKRLQGAPIIVISERAFGFDLRETIINGWSG